MGRVLLAALPPEELETFLGTSALEALTENTLTRPDALRAAIDEVRGQGWALVDQELELGLRSVAAPVQDAERRTVAALNVSAAVSRVPIEKLRDEILPLLLATADAVSTALGRSARSEELPRVTAGATG
jgi:IclR family transcriptional regulator, pca regulon regulatory protein